MMRVVELFAGVGGFRIGFEGPPETSDRSRFGVIWSNQWEPSTKRQHAAEVYVKRWNLEQSPDDSEVFNNGPNDVFVNKDIGTVVASEIPNHDILCGGFPCQDYSVARTSAKGLGGKKGVLWWEIHRILKEKMPDYALLENVDRLLKSPTNQRGRDFAVMLASLSELGYVVEWRSFSASDYGSPQRRKRVFILAHAPGTKGHSRLNGETIPFDWIQKEGVFAKTFPIIPFESFFGDSTFALMSDADEDLADVSANFKAAKGGQSPFGNAGVMISASHNAYQDNGIKIFARDGFKLPDEIEHKLETLMDDDHVESIRPTKSAVGKAYRVEDARGRYLSYVKTVLPESLNFEGLKVVVDCANGAAYQVAPRVLEEMGARVHAIGVEPNGRNINHGCGALYPDKLREAVLAAGADIGIALDGDADRLIVVDDKGDVLDGDCILAIGAKEMLDKGTLKESTLVSTVMSNLALDKVVTKLGGKVIRTKVGDRYEVEEMRKGGYSFGGENSGHLVYLDHATTGDGLLAALKLIAVMREADAPLSEIRKVLKPFPQSLVNVQVANKTPITELDSVQKAIAEVESKLAGEGRVMVRYSGTEPKARVLVEGPDAGQIESWAQDIAQELGRALS